MSKEVRSEKLNNVHIAVHSTVADVAAQEGGGQKALNELKKPFSFWALRAVLQKYQ